MRKLSSFKSVIGVLGAFLCVGAVLAQQAETPAKDQKEQKPPVSLSPALPVTADPAKMAEPASGTVPAAAVDVTKYVLGAQDQISVTMWDDKRFDGQYVIRPDGKISMPLLGEIQASGLTPLQLQDSINKIALSELKTPRATVNVIAVHSKHVYFDGEGIKEPGAMDLVIPIHLLEAISARGGFSEWANKKKIQILRDGKPLQIINGNKKSIYIRYEDMVDGKHPGSNPELKDNDHVYIK